MKIAISLLLICLVTILPANAFIIEQESSAATINTTDLLWPMPTKFSMDGSAEPTVVDPCAV